MSSYCSPDSSLGSLPQFDPRAVLPEDQDKSSEVDVLRTSPAADIRPRYKILVH